MSKQSKLPNGKYHREDGPAIIHDNCKAWYKDGLLHREDGPAIEWDNINDYYLNGIKYSELEYYKITNKI